MSVERCSGKYLILALSGLALSACSPSASTAAPAIAAAPAAAAAAVTTAPLVTGLPDFSALVQTYGPAVVNVRVTANRAQRGAAQGPLLDRLREFGFGVPEMEEMPQGQQRNPAPSGEGSGFIVSPDGYILTNRHVVFGAAEVTVKLVDRREYTAKVIGMDENTDVAVLKIDGSNLPFVRMGDPEKLRPGQWVVAIGSPFGMENSVTAGIVSATSRRIDGENFVPFIQTDVAVNPGNSGGPLFNLNGEVVGINSQIYSRSGGYMGMSFAIPIDMANSVREQLVSTGKVTRGRIGVEVQPLNAGLAESFGMDRPHGALIARVEKGEAADKAGLAAGDIILSVGGKPVTSEVLLPSMVAAIKPGTSTEFEVWREGKARKIDVKVGEVKATDVRTSANPRRGNSREEGAAATERAVLGLSLRQITAQEKQQVRTTGSLVVEDVSSAAERSGIEQGDIILGVGSFNVGSVDELREAANRVNSRNVPLRVQRGDRVSFAMVPKS